MQCPHLSVLVLMTAALLSAQEAQGQRITPRPIRAVALNPATTVIQPVPATALALRARLTPLLSPSAGTWVQSEARAIAGQNLPPDALMRVAMNDVAARFAGQKLSDADLVAISGLGLLATLRALKKALRLAKTSPQRRQVF